MYGDPAAIRRLASQLRERADEIRTESTRLVGQAEQARWSGLAADAMRERAHDRALELRRTARLHDDAAAALDHHADEVERLLELIAEIEQRVEGLVDEARSKVSGFLHGVVDRISPAEEVLARFTPPPPGDRSWLEVDLPGLPGLPGLSDLPLAA